MSAYSPMMHLRHVVLPHIADDPDVRQVGNGERVGRRQAWTPDWSVICWSVIVPDTGANTCDDARGMSGSAPSSPRCSFVVSRTTTIVVLGVLRNLQRALRNRAVVEQEVGAVELDLRQFFVLHGLAVVGKCARDVRASHFEQKLALFHFIAQPCIDFDDSPGGERRHRHLARNIRIDHAGDIQLRRGDVLTGRGQRKPLRMVHFEVVGVQVGLHGDRRRPSAAASSARLGRALSSRTRRRKGSSQHTESCCDQNMSDSLNHLTADGHIHLGRRS